MTNLWEKEFLERLRKERSAQHPRRRAPNSCMRNRVETVNRCWGLKREKEMNFFFVLHTNIWSSSAVKYSLSPQSSPCPTDPNGPGSWAETRRDTSSEKRKWDIISSCKSCGMSMQCVAMFSRGLCFLTEASSPERTPGFLLKSKCRRELEYSSVEHRAWERDTTPDREREREREGETDKVDRYYNIKRERTLKHFASFHYSYEAAAGISGCTVKQCTVSACLNVILKFFSGCAVRWDSNRRHASSKAQQHIVSQQWVVAGWDMKGGSIWSSVGCLLADRTWTLRAAQSAAASDKQLTLSDWSWAVAR